jgi:hypothetical protein
VLLLRESFVTGAIGLALLVSFSRDQIVTAL